MAKKNKKLLLSSLLLLMTSCNTNVNSEEVITEPSVSESEIHEDVNVDVVSSNEVESVSVNEVEVEEEKEKYEAIVDVVDYNSLDYNTMEIPVVIDVNKTDIMECLEEQCKSIADFVEGRSLILNSAKDDDYYRVNYFGNLYYVKKEDTMLSTKRIAVGEMIAKGYLSDETPIYDNYELKDEYDTLNKYEFVEIYKELDNCYLVQTIDTVGFIPKDNVQKIEGTVAVTDISEQESRLYEGNVLTYRAPVVTGKPGTENETDLGVFKVHTKAQNLYIVPGAWVDCVAYYNGGEGIHTAGWRGRFGGNIYMVNPSHGCTNMEQYDAYYFYTVLNKGDQVVVKH